MLQVLFDTLKFHGTSFTPTFWARVFESVLLPIFDHVRAEVIPLRWRHPLPELDKVLDEVFELSWQIAIICLTMVHSLPVAEKGNAGLSEQQQKKSLGLTYWCTV